MFLQSDGSNYERRENPLYGIWYLLEGLIQRVMYGLVIAAYKVEVIADVLNHSVSGVSSESVFTAIPRDRHVVVLVASRYSRQYLETDT
mgnify:CR=1 FL=1